jgi:hypothetical protein
MRPTHERLATLDEASSGGKGLRIDVSILRLLVAAAAVLGGLFAVAAFADADPAAPDTSRHLLVVPSTPEGGAALARSDVRVVARYPEFALVEAAGSDDTKLRGAESATADTTAARRGTASYSQG